MDFIIRNQTKSYKYFIFTKKCQLACIKNLAGNELMSQLYIKNQSIRRNFFKFVAAEQFYNFCYKI